MARGARASSRDTYQAPETGFPTKASCGNRWTLPRWRTNALGVLPLGIRGVDTRLPRRVWRGGLPALANQPRAFVAELARADEQESMCALYRRCCYLEELLAKRRLPALGRAFCFLVQWLPGCWWRMMLLATVRLGTTTEYTTRRARFAVGICKCCFGVPCRLGVGARRTMRARQCFGGDGGTCHGWMLQTL